MDGVNVIQHVSDFQTKTHSYSEERNHDSGRALREAHPTKVLLFRTHLPQYSLEAAAGKFGRQMNVEPEGWVEVRTDLPLTEGMFVVHVEGHSMEPTIPDASLCVFRSTISGSWEGKVMLLEDYGESGGADIL